MEVTKIAGSTAFNVTYVYLFWDVLHVQFVFTKFYIFMTIEYSINMCMHVVLYHTPSFKTNYYSMLHLYVVVMEIGSNFRP